VCSSSVRFAAGAEHVSTSPLASSWLWWRTSYASRTLQNYKPSLWGRGGCANVRYLAARLGPYDYTGKRQERRLAAQKRWGKAPQGDQSRVGWHTQPTARQISHETRDEPDVGRGNGETNCQLTPRRHRPGTLDSLLSSPCLSYRCQEDIACARCRTGHRRWPPSLGDDLIGPCHLGDSWYDIPSVEA